MHTIWIKRICTRYLRLALFIFWVSQTFSWQFHFNSSIDAVFQRKYPTQKIAIVLLGIYPRSFCTLNKQINIYAIFPLQGNCTMPYVSDSEQIEPFHWTSKASVRRSITHITVAYPSKCVSRPLRGIAALLYSSFDCIVTANINPFQHSIFPTDTQSLCNMYFHIKRNVLDLKCCMRIWGRWTVQFCIKIISPCVCVCHYMHDKIYELAFVIDFRIISPCSHIYTSISHDVITECKLYIQTPARALGCRWAMEGIYWLIAYI